MFDWHHDLSMITTKHKEECQCSKGCQGVHVLLRRETESFLEYNREPPHFHFTEKDVHGMARSTP